MTNTNKIITRAHELLVRHGHVKNKVGDTSMGFCARGAHTWARRELGIFYDPEAELEVDQQLCAAAGLPVNGSSTSALVDWNNAPERTEAEVIAAFAKAAQATLPKPEPVALTAPKPNPPATPVQTPKELVTT